MSTHSPMCSRLPASVVALPCLMPGMCMVTLCHLHPHAFLSSPQFEWGDSPGHSDRAGSRHLEVHVFPFLAWSFGQIPQKKQDGPPAENVGNELTHMVLLTKSQQLVPRSDVQPTMDPFCLNFCKGLHTDAPAPAPLAFKVETVLEDNN